MASNGNKLGVGLAVVGVLTVSILGYGAIKDLREKDSCAFDAWLNRDDITAAALGYMACVKDKADESEPDESVVGDIGLKDAEIKNRTTKLTFGDASMYMSGTATFIYNGPDLHDWPGRPDAYLFYNKDNAKTSEIEASLCVNKGEYAKPKVTDTHYSEINEEKFGKSTIESEVTWDVDLAPDGKSIAQIDIRGGMLDFCQPHWAQSKANEDLWDGNDNEDCTICLGEDDNVGQFGNADRNAYTYMMKDLLTTAAMAQYCPEGPGGLDMPAVREEIATAVMGDIIKEVGNADMVYEAYKFDEKGSNKVHVSLDPPSLRQAYYGTLFKDKMNGYSDGSLLPEIQKKEKLTIEGIAVGTCEADEKVSAVS